VLGYKSAAAIAARSEGRRRGARSRRRTSSSEATCGASLASAAEVHGISYVPGAADLATFDATSTTICDWRRARETTSDDLCARPSKRYWRNFIERRADQSLDHLHAV